MTSLEHGHVLRYCCHARAHCRLSYRAYTLQAGSFRSTRIFIFISMPKDTGKDCGGVRHMATTQGELKNLATHLIVDSRGVDAREIVSSS